VIESKSLNSSADTAVFILAIDDRSSGLCCFFHKDFTEFFFFFFDWIPSLTILFNRMKDEVAAEVQG
jgi:hypothetical protein